jgi:internalin A
MQRLPQSIAKCCSLTGIDLAAVDEFTVLDWDDRSWCISSTGRGHSGGSLSELPESLSELRNLSELYLHGNDSLRIPAEILGPTWQDVHSERETPASPRQILAYYARNRRGRRPLNEAKLILIGRGGVGKTSLIKRLVRGAFDEREPETPGIEIQPWPVTLTDSERVRLHVWDFGGQEILHATHQFFLTERTLYLLVLSGREGNPTQDAEYWLQLIRSFGGNSTVLIALNKSEQYPFDLNRGLLLEKYPFIVDFVKTDCRAGTGIPELMEGILKQTESLDLRKMDFPTDWFTIKERLAEMPENFVSWEMYQEICREFGEKDAQAQRDLASFLHILGIALNYRDDPRLKDTHVLNPRWVTEGIYSILRMGQKERPNGVLVKTDLAQGLDVGRYPASCHDFLLRLMEKFQLCFRLPGEVERYLVPELLGENQPDMKSLLDSPGLGFRYQYEVLPEGLLPRFIVQSHVLSEANAEWRWRTGVVLQRDGCHAVVRADARERRVDVHITGPGVQRRGVLAIIREKFDEQHADLKGLAVDERVPVHGEPGVTVSYRHLLALEEDAEVFFRPEGARHKIRVTDLLNGVESVESRANRRTRYRSTQAEPAMSKSLVFLSYCHDNVDLVRALHQEVIDAGESVWWDEDILGGQDWKLEIRKAMRNAYAVVLCLSRELESRFASGVYPEVRDAIGAYRELAPGNVFLIPVRLSQCEPPPIEIDATRTLESLQIIDLFPASKRADGLAKLVDSLRNAREHH